MIKAAYLAGVCGLSVVVITQVAKGQTVGTVSVCYYSTECSYADIPGIVRDPNEAQKLRDSGEHQGGHRPLATGSSAQVDAPAFEFTNTGTQSITEATFSIAVNKKLGVTHDVFHIGSIKPGSSFAIVPGASNDKKAHPAGSFFTYSSPGTPLDTSDSGPNDNALKFTFVGHVGKQKVTSGVITPGASLIASPDGTVAAINFLGGPGNADGPCNDCYPSAMIANITVAPATSKPEADDN